MLRLQAFPPLVAPGAHTLILGSMPGSASLAAHAYYAHPRNAFWPIVGELLGFTADAPYAERVRALTAAGYALWDVLGACRREGSLDSAIDPASLEVNDFATFLTQHPGIERIFFNGGFAERSFRRHALPLPGRTPALTRLPSTSPANASLTLDDKRAAWRAILR
ncbi:DNA-deoxyinosine glycosylase [Pseudazoarcus pumilus]|uniref:DNA-deoxyinosine glycosylase n=1 Tax=Pseudazoarcus pumilus TaxID=2067960 RepID=A0A2I6SAP3_9RHOO|nr:DNA-deoxyinosine glycosylase [Pseudazoarcus pumilus]AUN96323.1 DNA-deoxyinosine glycosylase [Pseudazoarcus pumilus]